jgi:cytoskeleton protein RodZ
MTEVMTEGEIPVLESEPARPLTVGEQLRTAREAKAIKIADLAQSMKLGVRQLEALEAGDWQALPGATFVRGFVRNYARLVGVDPLPLMTQLDGLLEQAAPKLALPQSTPASMPNNGPVQRRDYAFALGGLLFVLFAAGLYLLAPADLSAWRESLMSIVAGDPKPAEPTPMPVVAGDAAETVLPPGASVQETLNPQSVLPADTPVAESAAPATDASPLPASTPVAAEPAKATGAGLQISVKKESWVEVRDRNGNVLLSQRVPDGSERLLEGNGPFVVVLGNAPGVALNFKGKAVDLAPHTKGDVARLTVE